MADAERSESSGPAPDDAGFCEWVSVRAAGLRRQAYLLCGDWHAADDLVQDALISMYPKWPRIARGSSVDAYAYRVLFGKFVDAKRRPWRRERVVDAVPDTVDVAAQRGFADVDGFDDPLMSALDTLPAIQRAVLVLRFTDDLTVEEIAHVMNLPPGTVRSRLARANDALRACLVGQADTGPPSGANTPVVPAAEDMS